MSACLLSVFLSAPPIYLKIAFTQQTDQISQHCITLSLDKTVTTHLLSIERADWPKLHDMFKARDVNVWQREFPAGLPVEVSALNSTFINIFHDVVALIESKCVIKAKHVYIKHRGYSWYHKIYEWIMTNVPNHPMQTGQLITNNPVYSKNYSEENKLINFEYSNGKGDSLFRRVILVVKFYNWFGRRALVFT